MSSIKVTNTHKTKCAQEAKRAAPQFYNPPTSQLKTMALKQELNPKNNNVFNGRHLSDHTKATLFY